MKKILLTFLFIFLAFSVKAQKSDSLYFDVTLFKYLENWLIVNPPYDTIKNLQNVPPGNIRDTSYVKVDTFLVQLLSETLRIAEEKPFFNASSLKRNYRFTWLRSFEKQIVINIFEASSLTKIETKWFSRRTGVDSVKIKILLLNVIEEFETFINKIDFWAEQQTPTPEDGFYLDGASWILEGKKDGKYHFIYRHSPKSESVIRKIGEWLIKISDASNESKIY